MIDTLKRFTTGCVEALYFTNTGDQDEPEYDTELDPECLLNLQADCRSFWHRFGCYIEAEDNGLGIDRAGHDFWFTRNGHGAGFWDGDWPKYGEMLTKASEAYGEFDPEWID